MNNIVKRGIERASKNYTVSILVDEEDTDVLQSLTIPSSVKVDTKKGKNGTYITLIGEAMAVMELEESLYLLLTRNYTRQTNTASTASTKI